MKEVQNYGRKPLVLFKKMLTKVLELIGLKGDEAKLYLACLKLGTQNLSLLAKETKLSKSDSITALEHLLDRGFVSKYTNRSDFFTAESPGILLKILEDAGEVEASKLEIFSKTLPAFESYIDPNYTKPEIAYYEGKEGIIAAYEDTLTSKTDILALASIDDTESTFPRYVPRYYQRRKAAGILIRAIFPDSKMAKERQKADEKELRISRLIPKEQYSFTFEINIYDDKVAFFSLKEKVAIIIKNSEVASSMRSMFELCWKMAEIYNKN